MFPLKLKVYIMEGDRRIENFNKDQWEETCVIFQKLVRNLKEEIPELEIKNYCEKEIPHVTMDLVFKDDFPEEKVTYAISYLSGNETDNPVYFEGEEDPCMADSEIIFDEVEKDDSLLDRFNKMAVESSK
tara:strand:+ start:17 stop:406 length:390 start_codon:yes stop_codon:yes gene_type:complete